MNLGPRRVALTLVPLAPASNNNNNNKLLKNALSGPISEAVSALNTALSGRCVARADRRPFTGSGLQEKATVTSAVPHKGRRLFDDLFYSSAKVASWAHFLLSL